MRFAYRPFDTRWLYWESESGLLDRPRPDYQPHVFAGNMWMVFQKKARPDLSPPYFTRILGDLNQMNSGVYCVPCWLRESLAVGTEMALLPNLSDFARTYLERLGLSVEDLFHHVLAVLHAPAYNSMNADVLRAEGPRIPLPYWSELSARTSKGNTNLAVEAQEAAEVLATSVVRGRELAALLEPDTPVPGVTTGQLQPEIAAIAVPATTHGHNMFGDDFGLTAGWGHFGSGQAVMPGQGSRGGAALHEVGTRRIGRRSGHPGGEHLRHLSERSGVLAECAGERVDLPAGRVPGAEEVVVVSGAEGVGAGA